MPRALGTARDARSTASVIPAGGVHVDAEVMLWLVTTRVLATLVVTLGADCERLDAFAVPALTSTGVTGSTPEKATMPPAEPVDVLNVQL
jgi:hypothetical protein